MNPTTARRAVVFVLGGSAMGWGTSLLLVAFSDGGDMPGSLHAADAVLGLLQIGAGVALWWEVSK